MKFNKIFPEKKNSGIFENCRRREQSWNPRWWKVAAGEVTREILKALN